VSTTDRAPQHLTTSPVVAERVSEAKAAAARRLRESILETLKTPHGRRLWLWIILEVAYLEKQAPHGHPSDQARWAGRRDVAAEMNRRLVDFPDLRALLAKDRAQVEIEDAAFQADLARLEGK
jgi:hypothetical protein